MPGILCRAVCLSERKVKEISEWHGVVGWDYRRNGKTSSRSEPAKVVMRSRLSGLGVKSSQPSSFYPKETSNDGRMSGVWKSKHNKFTSFLDRGKCFELLLP